MKRLLLLCICVILIGVVTLDFRATGEYRRARAGDLLYRCRGRRGDSDRHACGGIGSDRCGLPDLMGVTLNGSKRR